MNILVIGPSPQRSRGGMATVINDIQKDEQMKKDNRIEIFESYIDGNKLCVLFFSFFQFIRFVFTKKNYDVYHIHVATSGSTFRKGYYVRKAKKWGKKVILHVHGAQYMEFFNSSSVKRKKRIIDILNSADMVIALSNGWKRNFENTIGIKNCVSLPNGIDTDEFGDAVCSLSEHINEFVLLGRLGKRKGVFDLINATEIAIKTNPEIKIYMAGDGEVDKVKALVKEKDLENNIEVVGWADVKGKKELLKRSATLILPSYNEGLPMSVLEGMASGKAIISTTVGAIPEVVTEDNGILITAGDVDALANALIKLSTNLPIVEKLSKNNIRKVKEEFSMRVMHDKLLAYYDTV